MLHGTPRQKVLGDDNGCFAAGLSAVRTWGGILEHPEASHAWAHHGLTKPPKGGGWIRADEYGGLTCCVSQGAYGHRAIKATWLYTRHPTDTAWRPPELKWGKPNGDFVRLEEGYHSKEERARAVRTGACQRLSHKQRAATPIPFRDLLLDIARSVLSRQSAPSIDCR